MLPGPRYRLPRARWDPADWEPAEQYMSLISTSRSSPLAVSSAPSFLHEEWRNRDPCDWRAWPGLTSVFGSCSAPKTSA